MQAVYFWCTYRERGACVIAANEGEVDWEPWVSMGIHKMPVDNYCAFYRVDEDAAAVTILRIFYAGRDIENIIK